MERIKDKVVIFGSSQVGWDALTFLKNDNVACFCDNAPSLAGTEKYGKTITSFAELKETYSKAIIVIAVAGSDAYTIAEQCEENGITGLFYGNSMMMLVFLCIIK